ASTCTSIWSPTWKLAGRAAVKLSVDSPFKRRPAVISPPPTSVSLGAGTKYVNCWGPPGFVSKSGIDCTCHTPSKLFWVRLTLTQSPELRPCAAEVVSVATFSVPSQYSCSATTLSVTCGSGGSVCAAATVPRTGVPDVPRVTVTECECAIPPPGVPPQCVA